MAKRQLAIYCDEAVAAADDFEQEMGVESRSEAGRELLLQGYEKYQRQKRMPAGSGLLKEAAAIGVVSAVIALSIGLALGSHDVLRLAGGFGGVTLMFGMIYAAMVARARGVFI